MDRTDHIFLLESPYMDRTDLIFLVEVYIWTTPTTYFGMKSNPKPISQNSIPNVYPRNPIPNKPISQKPNLNPISQNAIPNPYPRIPIPDLYAGNPNPYSLLIYIPTPLYQAQDPTVLGTAPLETPNSAADVVQNVHFNCTWIPS